MRVLVPPVDVLLRAHTSATIVPTIQRFQNGEVRVQLPTFTGPVEMVASCVAPVAASLMDICATLDAAQRAGATDITLNLLYMAHGRDPDMGALTLRLLSEAGADRIRIVDPHTEVGLPFTTLSTAMLFAEDIKCRFGEEEIIIISPDEGGAKRAQHLAQSLEKEALILVKKRLPNGDLRIMISPELAAQIQGKTCILVDDLIDSGRTLVAAAELLSRHGAWAIHGYVTHGVLGPGAGERLQAPQLTTLTLTDSLPWTLERPGIRRISLASLLDKDPPMGQT